MVMMRVEYLRVAPGRGAILSIRRHARTKSCSLLRHLVRCPLIYRSFTLTHTRLSASQRHHSPKESGVSNLQHADRLDLLLPLKFVGMGKSCTAPRKNSRSLLGDAGVFSKGQCPLDYGIREKFT